MANLTVVTTVAGMPANATGEEGGSVILQTALGFGTAFQLGDPVWGSLSASFAILTFLTGEPALEAFGPDAEGNLVSLGTLPAGWVVRQGDLGSDNGAARIYDR